MIVSHCDFIGLLGCFAGEREIPSVLFEKPLTIAASGRNPLDWALHVVTICCCAAEAPSFGIWQWTCWSRTRRSNQFKRRTFR